MEKEKLISKLNIKDYNNQLEKILSKKTFTEDTKNLLLSMLYKIENAYEDYKKVSVDAKTKREILEEILDIISNDCETIEIVQSKESFCDIEKKKITTYLNVRKMLYEIYQIIKPALEKTLNQGYSIASDEIIRDFDGWSWNIEPREIENILANLIYQVLKILVGQNVLETWKKEPSNDYITIINDTLTNRYKTELGEQLFKTIAQICILNITQTDEEERKRLIEKQKELQKEFNQLDNKKEYLETLGRTKKQIIEKIKKIDDILNNDIKLKKEFIKRNEVLDMNHRIFSLSDLSEILENERKELIDNLNKCSKKMEPLNFIKTKTEIENKLVLLKELELEKQNISREANAILVTLFNDYFATDRQKEILNNLLKQNQQILEGQKQEKYDPSNLFMQSKTQQQNTVTIQENNSENSLIEIKENFFTKFINFIKNIFKR